MISQQASSSHISLGKRPRTRSVSEPGSDEDANAAHGEAHVTGSVGSNENLDFLDEDLMRSRESRATGYVGQNSGVQWLSSLQRQTEHTAEEPARQPFGPPGTGQNAVTARINAQHQRRDNAHRNYDPQPIRHVTDSTFYLDSDELNVDVIVDCYEDPEPDVAERLFGCYYDTVHPSFPLVGYPTSTWNTCSPLPQCEGPRRLQGRIREVCKITEAERSLPGQSGSTSSNQFALRHWGKVFSPDRRRMGRR
jgi:hypothetical protein